jgi:RimJ/RimL family protein N-acetyltransferase
LVIPDVVVITGSGLILREWAAGDIDAMVELFDEASIDAWTPLESPFGTEAALRYLDRARRRRAEGAGVQLAITADGAAPLGEVLLFEGDQPGTAELAYAVGLAHRGQGLACRAVTLVMGFAGRSCGISAYALRISPANLASQRVARTAGFQLTDAPLEPWQRKDRRLEMAVWRSNELTC